MAITIDDTQQATLFETLGLPADTDPADVDAILAVIADLATQAQEAADNTKPSAVAAAAKRIGLEAIDSDTLAALQTDAQEGRQIKAAAARAKVEGAVDDAVAKGKITASRKKHWIDLLTADPGMGEILASIPNETAVPMTELGHATDSDVVEEAAWFR